MRLTLPSKAKQSQVLAQLVQKECLLPSICESNLARGNIPEIYSLSQLEDYVRSHRPCVFRSPPGEYIDGLDPELWHRQAIGEAMKNKLVPVRFQKYNALDKRVFQPISKLIKLYNYFDAMEQGENCEFYLANVDVKRYFNPFENHVSVLFKEIIKTKMFLGGAGPASLYLGAGSQATPLHFDPSENLYAVIEGEKNVTLFPPIATSILKPTGGNIAALFATFRGSLPPVHSHFDGALDIEEHLPKDWAGSQDLKNLKCEVKLSAGDLLYIPSCWWHFFRGGKDINTAVSYGFVPHPDKSPRKVDVSKNF